MIPKSESEKNFGKRKRKIFEMVLFLVVRKEKCLFIEQGEKQKNKEKQQYLQYFVCSLSSL